LYLGILPLDLSNRVQYRIQISKIEVKLGGLGKTQIGYKIDSERKIVNSNTPIWITPKEMSTSINIHLNVNIGKELFYCPKLNNRILWIVVWMDKVCDPKSVFVHSSLAVSNPIKPKYTWFRLTEDIPILGRYSKYVYFKIDSICDNNHFHTITNNTYISNLNLIQTTKYLDCPPDIIQKYKNIQLLSFDFDIRFLNLKLGFEFEAYVDRYNIQDGRLTRLGELVLLHRTTHQSVDGFSNLRFNISTEEPTTIPILLTNCHADCTRDSLILRLIIKFSEDIVQPIWVFKPYVVIKYSLFHPN
jgi:hypothetical protein